MWEFNGEEECEDDSRAAGRSADVDGLGLGKVGGISKEVKNGLVKNIDGSHVRHSDGNSVKKDKVYGVRYGGGY